MPEFTFHGELLDFLPAARRSAPVRVDVAAHQSAKHAIEALGVPHTEVGRIVVDGRAAAPGDRLPPAARIDVHPHPPEAYGTATPAPRFIADAHLGRLARHLRFAGFDTLWENALDDATIAAIAESEGRTVLTRDRALLMHRDVTRGCHIRAADPLDQLAQVARRYGLVLGAGHASRCLECNGEPHPVDKAAISAVLPARTRKAFAEFWRCPGCARIYWRGSHWQRMRDAMAAVNLAQGLLTRTEKYPENEESAR